MRMLMESLNSRGRGFTQNVRFSSGESLGGLGGKPNKSTYNPSSCSNVHCSYCKKTGHTIKNCKHPNYQIKSNMGYEKACSHH